MRISSNKHISIPKICGQEHFIHISFNLVSYINKLTDKTFGMNLQSCLSTTWKWHRIPNKHSTLFWFWNLEEDTRCSIISRKHFPIHQNVSPVHRIALRSCIKMPCRFIRQQIWKPEQLPFISRTKSPGRRLSLVTKWR